ncbi:MAG: DUF4399 domain-containing protein [Actinomycetota bacterium]|nr:DUF4399 domain-containing protein [Actinomycetota bacterium]
MVFAHAVGSSGPHVEFLVMAGALLVLGVLFYVQKAVKPVVSVVLVVLAIALGSGAFFLEEESVAQGRSVAITEPKPGDTVEADEPTTLLVAVNGGALAGESNEANAGHLHVYVDGAVVDMPSRSRMEVVLPRGRHTLAVEYVDAEHRPFDPVVKDEIEVEAR